MGTDLTTNLALIKPDLEEKIKPQTSPFFAGWAVQNATNCDKIDAIFRSTTHTYTPGFTATTTNPTLGSGSVLAGKWVRLFPKLVLGFIRVDFGGAGFAAGSGIYELTIPTTIDSDWLASISIENIPFGRAYLRDNNSTLNSQASTVYWETTTSKLRIRNEPGGSAWGSANPFAAEQEDQCSLYFMYVTAAA
jgi:hypothetical protein